MTKQQKIERYFKALGWTYDCNARGRYFWWMPSNPPLAQILYGLELPNILDHYPSFKKHVVEVMGEKGYSYSIDEFHKEPITFEWFKFGATTSYKKEIADNNITEAAVISATEYLENRK